MSEAEEFCLRWNNYEKGIASTVQKLRLDQDFLDVSIFCSGSLVRAHRAILSSCSPVFQRILRENVSSSCTIVLWDVGAADLRALLDFVYLGEVTVRQENIETFLWLANRLQIEGLSEKVDNLFRGADRKVVDHGVREKKCGNSEVVNSLHNNDIDEAVEDKSKDDIVEVKSEADWSHSNYQVNKFDPDPENTGGGEAESENFDLTNYSSSEVGGDVKKQFPEFSQQVMQFLKGNKGKLWNFFTVIRDNPRYAQCNVTSCQKRISRGSDDPCKMTSAPLKKHLITCHTSLIADEMGLTFF